MELFGIEIKKKLKDEPAKSFVPPSNDDGALTVAGAGIMGTYIDLAGNAKNESELVNQYRDMSLYPEVDCAIDDIVNEAIVLDPKKELVTINLDDLKYSDAVKNRIIEEFNILKERLEFNQLAYEIFKKWYIDGRLYYHTIIDEKNPELGIKEIRFIDPRNIRKVRQVQKSRDKNNTTSAKIVDEYFIYSESGFGGKQATMDYTGNQTALKITKDSIVYVTSGLLSPNGDQIVSYLQKAIKVVNQLKTMEDSLVIYRISRAPERRIFYVDVGSLPKAKAEQYLADIMNKFKNKMTYDSTTGLMKDDRKQMTMIEDFWMPRREGGRGTEVTNLPGGQNLSELDDVLYFQKKLYKALNVPVSRLDSESVYTFGRSTEISRDEVKFAKFITRLRNKFSDLFIKLLEKQLILKKVISADEWPEFKDCFKFEYCEDNHFAELRNTELLRDRISMLRDLDDYVGRYFSNESVRRNVLYQTEEDMAEIDKQIQDEKSNPQYQMMMPPTETTQQ